MDCTLRMWNVSTGECTRTFKGHRHWVKTVTLTKKQDYLVSQSLDNQIIIWNLKKSGHNPVSAFA